MLVTSVSQLSTIDHCERKWGWAYLEKIRGSNAFAEFGTKVHEQLESWLTSGQYDHETPEGKVAESGFHHWPRPGTPGVGVEITLGRRDEPMLRHAQWLRESPDGFTYGFVGFQDVDMPGVVGDHKSTTNFAWAKTEETLLDDLQAAVYALAKMDRDGIDEVVCQWVYYRTRGATKSLVVRVTMSRAMAEDVVARKGDPLARRILDIRQSGTKRALDLVPNTNACADYGGCVYRDRCNLSAMDVLKGKFAHMNLKEKMLAKLSEKKTPPESPPAAPPPAAAAPPPDVNPPEKTKIRKGPKAAPSNKEVAELTEKLLGDAESVFKEKYEQPPATKPHVVLLVNCLPNHSDLMNASAVINRAQTDMRVNLGIMDYRLVEFGKGPGLLCAAVRKLLEEYPPTGTVFIDTTTDSGRVCLEVFESFATVVIRGTR